MLASVDDLVFRLMDEGPTGALLLFAPVILLAVLGFSLIIGLGIRAAKKDRARILGLQTWAQQRDRSFTAEDPDLARIYPQLPVESGGRRMRFQNVIRGRLAGRPLTAFDYSYETTSMSTSTSADGSSSTSSSTTTHRIQVLAVALPADWPAVKVSPRGLGAKLATMFGGQDVRIGHEAFDRAFRVTALDEAGSRRLLSPMAPALLARSDQEIWVEGSTLLALRRGVLEATDLERWMEQVQAALALAPGVQER